MSSWRNANPAYELVKQGVKFVHFRTQHVVTNKDGTVRYDSNGGMVKQSCLKATAAYVPLDKDNFLVTIANCSPRDNASKEIGRLVSQGRLEKAWVMTQSNQLPSYAQILTADQLSWFITAGFAYPHSIQSLLRTAAKQVSLNRVDSNVVLA